MYNQNTINKRYTDLCAKLGDTEFRLGQLQARKKALQAELQHMEIVLPQMTDLEQASQQAAAQQAALATKLQKVADIGKQEEA